MIPYSYAKNDEVTTLVQERNVRWILDKWRDKMSYPFTIYSSADESDAVDKRGRVKKDSKSLQLMNLNEMLQLLRDANVLDDERCTVRAVTTFFVIVNMDDEIYETVLHALIEPDT